MYHHAARDIVIKVANSTKMRLCHLTPKGLASLNWKETSFWKEILSVLLKTMPRLWLQLLLLWQKFVIHSPRSVNHWDFCKCMCFGVESLSKDVHASAASLQSSLGVLSGLFVDLLEEENSAEYLNQDDSEGDDRKRPFTQLFLKHPLHMPVKFIGP